MEDATGERNYAPLKLIILTFNKDIDPSKVSVTTSPLRETEVKNGDSPNKIVISPINPLFWEPETLYIITINPGAIGIDGSSLEAAITYRIKTRLPQNPF